MYSTGTEFYKLIGEAQDRQSPNTAADVAKRAKETIESWTPFRIEQMTVWRSGEIYRGMTRYLNRMLW